jgi:hypothetical protein
MTVDYSKLRSITARQVTAALEKDGFRLQRQKEVTAIITIPTDVALPFLSITLPTHFDVVRCSIIEIQARWTANDVTRAWD